MVSLILLAVVVSYVVLVAYEFSWPPSIPREGVATFPLKAASVPQPGGLAEPGGGSERIDDVRQLRAPGAAQVSGPAGDPPMAVPAHGVDAFRDAVNAAILPERRCRNGAAAGTAAGLRG
jgi:hypothetical protein